MHSSSVAGVQEVTSAVAETAERLGIESAALGYLAIVLENIVVTRNRFGQVEEAADDEKTDVEKLVGLEA